MDEDRPPVTYQATYSIAKGKFVCLVSSCVGAASTKYGMRRHFRFLHPQDLVNGHGKRCYPNCGCYGMQVNLATRGHQAIKLCKAMPAARLTQKTVSDFAMAMDAKFYTYGENGVGEGGGFQIPRAPHRLRG